MKFEGSIIAWLMLAVFPIGLPIVLALILAHVVRIRAGCLTLLILVGVGVVTAFSIAAYLDSRGTTVVGEVLSKKESVAYHPDGSWNRKMEVTFRYRTGDSDPYQTLVLNVLPAHFDELHEGDLVPLLLPAPASLFAITRLEDQTILPEIWSLIGDQPFFFLFMAGLILLLSARFVMGLSLPTVFLVGGLMTVGTWWISDVVLPLWLQASIRMDELNTVTGTVKEIYPPYAGEGRFAWMTNEIYSAYDLILVDLLPLGRSQNILAVDMVDPGSADLQVGQSLNIEYSPGHPRFAILPNATRNYIWKNGLISTVLALLAGLVIFQAGTLLKERSENSDSEEVGVDTEDY